MKHRAHDLYEDWDDGLAQPVSNLDIMPILFATAVVLGSVSCAVAVTAVRLARALRTGRVIIGGDHLV